MENRPEKQRALWQRAIVESINREVPKSARICNEHFPEGTIKYQDEDASSDVADNRVFCLPNAVPVLNMQCCPGAVAPQFVDVVVPQQQLRTTCGGQLNIEHQSAKIWIAKQDKKKKVVQTQKEIEIHVKSQPVSLTLKVDGEALTEVFESPIKRSLKRKLSESEKREVTARKKIRRIRYENAKLQKRQASLQKIVEELQSKNLISGDISQELQTAGKGVEQLFTRIVSKARNLKVTKTYPPELRAFAITLDFYSPKAYDYVKKTFGGCLPHRKTIYKWYSKVKCGPGFTAAAFEILENKAHVLKANGKDCVCSILMDEMATRKNLEFKFGRHHGRVDIGTDVEDETLPLAKEAFVVMAVGLNDSWKVPIAYFFIKSITSEMKRNLILTSVSKLYDVGVLVKGVVFDGAANNIRMAQLLGCCLDPKGMQPSFKHPCDPNEEVYVLLDVCHMLKLMRNVFGDYKYLRDEHGEAIKFSYIEKLHNLQEHWGIHLRNKLRNAHVFYHKKKMNVKLAAQLFSDSVADALQFCLDSGYSEFEGCEATIKFLRLFNRVFDILNSRSLHATGYKHPITEKNYSVMVGELDKAKQYICGLRLPESNNLLIDSSRKVGAIGFIMSIESVKKLFTSLKSKGMSFLLTYKLSQDHLEMFFGQIRRHRGCDNNPTCDQFITAYNKLLMTNEVAAPSKGNCSVLSDFQLPILTVSSHIELRERKEYCVSKMHIMKLNNCSDENRSREEVELSLEIMTDDSYYKNIINSDAFASNVVTYVAGYVCFKLQRKLKCSECISALFADEEERQSQRLSFIHFVDRGRLVKPAKDVSKICVSCEAALQAIDLKKAFYCNVQKLVNKVCLFIDAPIFSKLDGHVLTCDPLNNHACILMQCIASLYIEIRLTHAAKLVNDRFTTERKVQRHFSNKLVLFNGT